MAFLSPLSLLRSVRLVLLLVFSKHARSAGNFFVSSLSRLIYLSHLVLGSFRELFTISLYTKKTHTFMNVYMSADIEKTAIYRITILVVFLKLDAAEKS